MLYKISTHFFNVILHKTQNLNFERLCIQLKFANLLYYLVYNSVQFIHITHYLYILGTHFPAVHYIKL